MLPDPVVILSACNGMFHDMTALHSNLNMTNLIETPKLDWKMEKVSKYLFPQLLPDKIETVDLEREGEKDIVINSSLLLIHLDIFHPTPLRPV